MSRWRERARLLPSIARLVAPGTMDAGLSSVVGFVVAIYAARTLSVAEFGEYGLLFAATVLARDVPQQLYLAPARIRLLELPAHARLGALRGTLGRGLLIAVVSAAVVPIAGFALASQVDVQPLIGLGLTAAALSVVSPLMDHQRASFHHAQRSWLAVASSGVHLVAAIVALLLAQLFDVDRSLVPFGAVTVGALFALVAGGFAMRLLNVERQPAPSIRSVRALGIPLLANNAIGHSAPLVGALIVGTVVSAEALGYAEGARIVGQPILVLAVGLQAVLQPRLLEAGRARNRLQVRHYSRILWFVLGGVAVPYLALAGTDHLLNPLARLMPVAYGLPGLAALYILHNVVNSGLGAPISVILGMERTRVLLRATTLSVAVAVATTSLSAPVVGGYAGILGGLSSLLVRGKIVTTDARRQLNRSPADVD